MYKLYKFQQYGVDWMINQEDTYGFGLLADEMGTGKTIQIYNLIIRKPVQKTLIIVPSCIVNQWNTILGNISSIYNKNKQNNHKIIILSHNSMSRLTNNSNIYNTYWNRLIIDEAHIICNPQTQQSNNLYRIHANYKWAVSGTPFSKSIKDVKRYYKLFNLPNKINYKIFIKTFMLRRKYQDIIEIKKPKINIQYINIPIDKDRNHYIQLINKLNNMKNQGSLCSLEQIIRLEQISIDSSIGQQAIYCKSQDPNDIADQLYDINKLEYIVNQYKVHKQKTIVFCRFNKEIEILYNLFKKNNFNPGIINGKNKYISKNENKNDINNIILKKKMQQHFANKIWSYLKPNDIMIIQVKTANVGLNLQYYNSIYITIPMWNPYYEKQVISRVYRIGQQNDVNINILCSTDCNNEFETIDQYIIKKQHKKINSINKFIELSKHCIN